MIKHLLQFKMSYRRFKSCHVVILNSINGCSQVARQLLSVLTNSPKINQPDDIVVERNYVKIKKVQLDDRLKPILL